MFDYHICKAYTLYCMIKIIETSYKTFVWFSETVTLKKICFKAKKDGPNTPIHSLYYLLSCE